MKISLEKPIVILPTQPWRNCDGELRETVGIDDLHNVCILWNIGTDYHATKSNEKGELVVSLTPHYYNVTL